MVEDPLAVQIWSDFALEVVVILEDWGYRLCLWLVNTEARGFIKDIVAAVSVMCKDRLHTKTSGKPFGST